MGLTRIKAEQISDIDYKQAVRAIQTTNVTLAGGAPSQVDGVNLMKNDRVLVAGQNTGSENGLYYVATLGTGSNGTWARTSDANQTGEIEAGMIVMVTEGTTYADTQWKLTTNDPIVIGTTPLTFVINILSSVGGSNTQIQYNSAGTLAGSPNLTWDGSQLYVGATANIGGNVLPAANVTYSLGSTSARWNDLWIANSSIYIGDVVLATTGSALTINGANVLTGNAGAAFSTTGNVTGGNLLTSGQVSATGNITGGNIAGTLLAGTLATAAQPNVTSLGTLTSLNSGAISSSGNVTGANILTGGLISATGNITGGNLTVSTGTVTAGNIVNSNSNGVGNIGSSTGYFNTVFAKATSAQYADVAEKYVADRFYPPGTVMEIGGAAEVQATTSYASTRIAGVVSTAPALIMNSTQSDANAVELALLGRVPCRVTGNIDRGDLLTSSDQPGVATALAAQDYRPGSVIGKALEGHRGRGEGMIEVMVGRL